MHLAPGLPGNSFYNGRGECERSAPGIYPDPVTTCDNGATCVFDLSHLPVGGCPRPVWLLSDESEPQCSPGFECLVNQGCVPIKTID